MDCPARRPARPSRLAEPLATLLAVFGLRLGLGLGLGLGLLWPPASQAGLLKPVLLLMRPQLEQRLSRLCLNLAAGGNPNLENSLRRPCQKLATPASHCLVEETDSSGREMAVIAELLSGKLGEASELVLKRCAARLLNLPRDSFQEVPLNELGKQLRSSRRGDSATTTPLPPADAAP